MTGRERGVADIEVRAPMAGSVWKIVVKAGDIVAEDDPLIILESMKMEVPLTAPEDGKVKAVCVSEGDAISEADIAVILET